MVIHSISGKTGKVRDPDLDLLHAAQGGELSAFEELVTRHESRIYGLARRIIGVDADAQDATQQTFLHVVEHLNDFLEQSLFATWLTTIAVHTALKILRKRRGLAVTSLEEATDPGEDGRVPHPEFIADWRETPDQLVQRHDTREWLDRAVTDLDPDHRAVFLLRDVEGLSVQETAKALGIREGNVKVRLLRARLQLRERLTRLFGDEAHRYIAGGHRHKIPAGRGVDQ